MKLWIELAFKCDLIKRLVLFFVIQLLVVYLKPVLYQQESQF